MALKSRTWACPDCDGQFTTIMDDKEGAPRFCQLCGMDMAADAEPIPNFSRIRNEKAYSVDRVYRQMETSSAARAVEAADMMGTSVAEQSNIKVTNMKDNLREGDTSFMAPPPTPIKTNAPPPRVPVMDGSAGLATAGMIRSNGGSVGHTVMDGFKQNHNQRARQMQQAGQMGSYTGKK